MSVLHFLILKFSIICVACGFGAIWCDWDDTGLFLKLFLTSFDSGIIVLYLGPDEP